MKFALPGAFTLLLLAALSNAAGALETAPSPCGKSFSVSGKIEHYKLPAGVSVDGDPGDGTFAQEIFGPSFTANVEGLPEGDYTVVIDLAEVYSKGLNQRVMRIASGDTVLADKLDLFAAAGFAKAYQVKGTVHHQADTIGGPLAITFTGLKRNAKMNTIHILDSQGNGVACVKAADLISAEDASTMKIPEVTGPVVYTDPSQPMAVRIDDLISRISLAEKANQLVNAAPAIPRLNLSAYNYWNECLHGVARNGAATVFPQAIGMSAIWDDAMMYRVGQVIADEARAKYYQAVRDGTAGKDNHGLNFWAPNINIFRDPRWGRGQETYGEDPWLTSRNAIGFITGIQQEKDGYLEAMACAKHFAVHSGPEWGRLSFNVNPEPRDLYETYLPQFQAAVQEAHVGAVMAAYNSIDNVHCVVNPWLLTDLLRKTWGFRGHVVSDCSAVPGAPGAIQALKAGLDLECGGNFRSLAHAVTTGAVTEEEINNALHHVLEVRFRLGLFDPPDKVPFSNIPMSDVESPEHLELARQVARESIVLLKNDGILPLDKSKLKRIAVVGPNADATNMLNGNYNGKPTHPVNILQGIRAEVGTGVEVTFSKGCPLIVRQGDPKWKGSPDFQNAVETTKSADVIIFVGGIDATIEGEESKLEAVGFAHGDRTRIDLPEPQETLLQALRATGKPVIFINCTGSAVAMPWEAANLSGILQAWYPGVEGGAAVADILFGNYNPAGRLPITFYEKTEDLPEFIDYRMANRTYRYFTGKVLFPFGYGLSYTTFQYGPITPSASSLSAANTLHISVPVQNTGSRDGDEVVQVYLKHLGSSVPQPIRSLVAFRRVPISAGASSPVAFDIPVERFHYWDVVKKAYVVEPGTYEIEVGASSSDIRQTCQLSVK